MKVSSSTLDQQILYANVMNDVYPDERGRFGPFLRIPSILRGRIRHFDAPSIENMIQKPVANGFLPILLIQFYGCGLINGNEYSAWETLIPEIGHRL